MYADVDPTQDTEFHDALRKHGIIPPKPPSRSPSPELPSESERRNAKLHALPIHSLQHHLDTALDSHDAQQVEEIQFILRQRAKAELRQKKRNRFGRVYPIQRPDYTREITEASKVEIDEEQSDEDEGDEEEREQIGRGLNGNSAQGDPAKRKGTGVVCFLYKDGMPTCELLKGYLNTLAERYPATKFVSIVGAKCIPNYPDKNLPTLLIYRNGELHRQMIGLRPEIGLSGMDTKLEDIELVLTAVGALDRPPLSSQPAQGREEDTSDSDDSSEENKTKAKSIRNATGRGTGMLGAPTDRRPSAKTQEEEDAELDWDL
ncbi:Conserved phosducin-like protein [Ceraceosorus bombacis]|uniref:Conserved phosducin-like protein n=1 Tax=Ceraceosorus bombacis TaxID=401625 RepID=A0A0P1BFJ9_9BASI|nr:Conserved phosducin-like protein [Ceraceosorus bombacis]